MEPLLWNESIHVIVPELCIKFSSEVTVVFWEILGSRETETEDVVE